MTEPKERFHKLFAHCDFKTDLDEIRELLDVVFTWRNSLHGEIADAEQSWRKAAWGYAEMAAEASTIDLYYQSVFRNAAVVQAAVGTLAPFIEGFLAYAFDYLLYLDDRLPSVDRKRTWADRTRLSGIPKWKGQEGQAPLMPCVKKLVIAYSVGAWLDADLLKRLDLLFTFRNRSLHNAYRWPKDTIKKFETCVGQEGWGPWVQWAKIGSDLWMAYLSDTFLSEQLSLTESMVNGFSAVAKERGGEFRADPNDMQDLFR